MLSIASKGCNRREFLRIGSLGVAGLSLPRLFAAGAEAKSLVKDKSVVFLLMHGGPAQTETFDPKMTAPDGIRSCLGETATKLPGVTFGSTFTKLAGLADKLAIVRSYVPENVSHLNPKPLVQRDRLNATLGSIYARVAGMNHPVSGLPTNVALLPRAVDPKALPPEPGNQGHSIYQATGDVGSSYAPFDPSGGSEALTNMRLNVTREQLDDRRGLLAQFDSLKRDIDRSGTMSALDRFQEQAVDVVLRGAADAFDLSKEDPRVIARYDTAAYARNTKCREYTDNANAMGKQLLLARRLCEAGCGFVTIFNAQHVWDMHGNPGDTRLAPVPVAMPIVGGAFDHGVSAFIEDVEARSLSDKILLVCCGEMGRTPRLQSNGGRDHWANLAPLLIYGGGLKMGQVIGQSSANGGEPASDPIRVRDLVATIFDTVFDVGELRVAPGLDKVAGLASEGTPIRQLVGG